MSERVFRNGQAAAVQAVAGVVGFVATAAPALTASGSNGATLLVFKAVFVTLGVAVLLFGLLGARSRVVAGASGVLVVNPLSKRQFAWEQIRLFRLGRWGLIPNICLIELRDGETWHAWGLAGRNPGITRHDRRVEEPLRELNDLLAGAG